MQNHLAQVVLGITLFCVCAAAIIRGGCEAYMRAKEEEFAGFSRRQKLHDEKAGQGGEIEYE